MPGDQEPFVLRLRFGLRQSSAAFECLSFPKKRQRTGALQNLTAFRCVYSKLYVKEPAFVLKSGTTARQAISHACEAWACRARKLPQEWKIVSSSLPLFSRPVRAGMFVVKSQKRFPSSVRSGMFCAWPIRIRKFITGIVTTQKHRPLYGERSLRL